MKMLTNFRFIFTPRKIVEVEEYIKERHISINERYTNLSIDDECLIELLKTINGLDNTELVSFSYRLRTEDLFLLANYMPRNEYNVDLKKIYIILKTRFRGEFIGVLFERFKDNYDNKEFNEYFIELLNFCKNSHEILNMSKDTLEIIKKWLREDNLVSSIVQSCLAIKKDFNSFMLAFKFEEDTLIYKECQKYLYIICNKDYYLFGNIDEILNVFKTYTLNEKLAFMNNYLSLLEIEEFQEPILSHIYCSYGDPSKGLYDNIWENINHDAVEKYKMWLAQKLMRDFFGEDERYVFWYSYIKNLQATLLHVNERQLFIDFGEFVVIEFRHIGNAAYMYKKSDFDKYFRRFINRPAVYSDGNFKYKEIALNRIIHSGEWQYRTSNLIRGGINRVQRY